MDLDSGDHELLHDLMSAIAVAVDEVADEHDTTIDEADLGTAYTMLIAANSIRNFNGGGSGGEA